MGRYFEPLRVYVKGSSYRHLGESAELVSAFFVSRFARRKPSPIDGARSE